MDDQELRRWAVERAMSISWSKPTEAVLEFAETLFDFVKGEENDE